MKDIGPSPTFSILLPTKNRLDLLKGAVETVLRQDFDDWEIVISDNCSEDDVGGWVETLAEPRVVYLRSDVALAVTDNWNRALDASTGKYVVMLGDDDGLTPGYMRRVVTVMKNLDEPDFLYHGAYIFSFPNALADQPESQLQDVSLNHSILQRSSEPAILASEYARQAAREALRFNLSYGFNMQYFVFSRSFISRMRVYGNFYQGPFPDFYAANIAMLIADRIAIVADPMVVIGISPKSYGFFHFNKSEKDGEAFLNAETDPFKSASADTRRQILPGTNMLTSWLISVSLIPEKLGSSAGITVDVGRYRRLQILHNLIAQARGDRDFASFSELWPHLSWPDRLFAINVKRKLGRFGQPTGASAKRLRAVQRMARQQVPTKQGKSRLIAANLVSIVGVFDYLSKHTDSLHPKTCPYCHGNARHLFFSRDMNHKATRTVFEVAECQACDLLYITNPPDDVGV